MDLVIPDGVGVLFARILIDGRETRGGGWGRQINLSDIPAVEVDEARKLLTELMTKHITPEKTVRRDREGRRLWRLPRSAYGIRIVADGRRVIWLGQAAPPPKFWGPEQ